MAIKKISKYAMTVVACIATRGTVWASSTDVPLMVATEAVSGAADEIYNELSMTGKAKVADIISVVMPPDIVSNIECDKDNGAISKIQSGVGKIRGNSNQNVDLPVITVQDDSNGDGSIFFQTVNLYSAEDNKTLDEIKALSEAKLESGAQSKKITTL